MHDSYDGRFEFRGCGTTTGLNTIKQMNAVEPKQE